MRVPRQLMLVVASAEAAPSKAARSGSGVALAKPEAKPCPDCREDSCAASTLSKTLFSKAAVLSTWAAWCLINWCFRSPTKASRTNPSRRSCTGTWCT
eukprot:8050600-Alexandrium_andersonii.AAC.1